jgi:hypothetical protein
VNCAVVVVVAVDELDELAPPAPPPAPPAPAPDPPDEPDDPLVPTEVEPFVTTSPTTRFTAVTRPAIGDVSVVPLYAA